ncbi:uncharacterized protein LOC103184087 [Callorhinchus milii]|uniref:uncharacterized protein LOC103184087 n=1 Tax=Callorhinchus milii TaxID=7868 RepID=UPI001C3FB6E6|nr:uncharacterized protein LOC103184087 [Callorhinchus milii]
MWKTSPKMDLLPVLFLILPVTVHSAVLSESVLAHVIARFEKEAKANKVTQEGNFAVLMVLSAPQCLGERPLEFIPNKPAEKGRESDPIISEKAEIFLADPEANYVAVYPTGAMQSAESKLLYPPQGEGKGRASVAMRLEELLRARGFELGCVLLFSRRLPSAPACEHGDTSCGVAPGLRHAPFVTAWAGEHVGRYMAYGSVRHAKLEPEEAKAELERVSREHFHVRRCELQDEVAGRCQVCYAPDFCVRFSSALRVRIPGRAGKEARVF